MKYKKGSNQHRTRHKGLQSKTWVTIILLLLFIALLFYIGLQTYSPKLISPLAMSPEVAYAEYKIPDLAPLPEREANSALIQKVWGKDAQMGIAIARCESGLRTLAKNENMNATEDQGLFQINTVHQMPDMFNPTANALYAYQVYQEQGTTPWLSSSGCWNN